MRVGRWRSAAAGVTLMVALAACGSGDGPADSSSSSGAGQPIEAVTMAPLASPGGTAPGATDSPPAPGSEPGVLPTATPTDPAATDGPGVGAPQATAARAAQIYLQGRENQSSWYQENPTSWVAKAATVISPTLRAELEKAPATGGDALWDLAHEKRLAVTVISQCEAMDAAGPPTATWTMLQCSVIDRPVGRDGTPLPTTQIPAQWQLVGTQQAAILEMSTSGGRWVVKRDWTGQAS